MSEKSSERVRRHRETQRRHRLQLDQACRRQLLEELGAKDPPISTLALIDCATSAYTEMSVIYARFLHGNADETSMERMSSARSQLIRALRALGLPKPAAKLDEAFDFDEHMATIEREIKEKRT